jgi:small-conductance mechanosensitive channel
MQILYELFEITSAQVAGTVLNIAVILLVLLVALRLVSAFFRRAERRLRDGGRDITPLRYLRYAVKAAVYLICLTAALRHVPGMDAVMTSLLAGSGIAAVVVGLASQQALGNIVSGAVILLFRPFKVGDRVRYHGLDLSGVIAEVDLRHTEIRTAEESHILIPNSLMNSNVVEVLPRE